MSLLPLVVAGGYLLGTFPAGTLAGRARGLDIRRHGSGNPGAANVTRVLGWGMGLAVLAADVAKGWLAAILLPALTGGGETAVLLGGLAAVAGHVWPVFSGGRGGKGVATAGGALLALHPAAFAGSAGVFAALLALTRRVSAASIAAAVALPAALLAAAAAGRPVPHALAWFAMATGVLVPWTHRANIGRLRAGTEPVLRDGRDMASGPGGPEPPQGS